MIIIVKKLGMIRNGGFLFKLGVLSSSLVCKERNGGKKENFEHLLII